MRWTKLIIIIIVVVISNLLISSDKIRLAPLMRIGQKIANAGKEHGKIYSCSKYNQYALSNHAIAAKLQSHTIYIKACY